MMKLLSIILLLATLSQAYCTYGYLLNSEMNSHGGYTAYYKFDGFGVFTIYSKTWPRYQIKYDFYNGSFCE